MKNWVSESHAEKSWLIQESAWDPRHHAIGETQFSQGNGVMGLRGSLEELPPESVAGTYIAGLYDKTSAQETEIVNLPNPLHFKITVNGEKLGIAAMDVLKHSRTLDMRNGVVTRRTVYQDSQRKRHDYQSLRFVSYEDKNILVYRATFTPLDGDAEITVRHDVDAGISNHGVLTEGKKRHFQISHVVQSDDSDFLCVRTLETGVLIAYASTMIYQVGKKKRSTGDHAFELRLKKGQTACFTKIICLNASRESNFGIVERSTRDTLENCMRLGYDTLLKRHLGAFRNLWKSSDIIVRGVPAIQRALRFNLYHLLICGPREAGRASIGAKTLSGEGYRGHIFWDADIFIVPFFIFTQPHIAKNMLLYRYDRLEAARKIAKQHGYKGVQFPWESANTGCETTPDWAKDFDGRIIKVKTGEQEHHIVADIAYTVYYYFMVTGDEEFMLNQGYEMLFETARFWASRAVLNKKRRGYDIRRVIGPDEFHEGVNNNAYTNMMARWNLAVAHRMYNALQYSHRATFAALVGRLNLKPGEVKKWTRIARRLYFNVRKDNVIEQFEGFFKKKGVRIISYGQRGLPDIPVGLDLSKISRTQFVKQADVVMMLHLFSTTLREEVKKKNYNYYVARTLHKSSLSPSVYSIVGNELGDQERAYSLFLSALFVDLEDVRGGTKDGIHAASLGGVWQSVVNGFGGVRLNKDRLSINPRLPKAWKKLMFTLQWKGYHITIQANHKLVRIRVRSSLKNVRLPAQIFGKPHQLTSSGPQIFHRPSS